MSGTVRRCPAGHEPVVPGRPRRRCRTELVARRVTQVDADLLPAEIDAAIVAVAAHGATLRDLTRALEGGPEPLLVGAPASVGRLVAELRARGSTIPEAACVRCGRTGFPLIASSEGGVCQRCRNRQLATACARCGGVKPVAGRGEQGQPLCAACAPRPRRPCSACGRTRIIARRARGDDGDLCDRCYLAPTATCRVVRAGQAAQLRRRRAAHLPVVLAATPTTLRALRPAPASVRALAGRIGVRALLPGRPIPTGYLRRLRGRAPSRLPCRADRPALR